MPIKSRFPLFLSSFSPDRFACLASGFGPLVLTVFAFFAVGVARAAPVTEAELAKNLQFYRSLRVLDVAFHQTKRIVDAGMDIESEGHLHLENGTTPEASTILWEITKPAVVRITLDARGIDLVNGSGASATHQHYAASELPKDGSAGNFRSLGAWLRLDAREISENYAVETTAEHRYRFTPKKPGGPFSKIEMELGSAGKLERLWLYERAGDEMLLKFAQPTVKR